MLGSLVVIAPSVAAEAGDPVVSDVAEVYRYDKSDPYDLTNAFGFNHAPSITRMADGSLFAAWFSGPFEASIHQVLLGAVSLDGGKTWDKAGLLQDEATRSDFDPAFIAGDDANWLFYSVGRWNRYPFVGLRDAERREVGVGSYRLMMRTMGRDETAWSEGRQLLEETGWGCRSNGIVLSNGDLVLPIYHFKPPYTASVLISSDRGETWQRHGDIHTPEKIGAAEPTITELPDGRLLMALRTYDGRLWLVRSDDAGRTWADPEQTDITATSSSHFIMTARDGRLLLIHNPTEPPLRTLLTLRISADSGKTWGEPLVVDRIDPPSESDADWSRQVSYPSAVELDDGTVVVVWARLEIGNRHQSGVIRSARVSLD